MLELKLRFYASLKIYLLYNNIIIGNSIRVTVVQAVFRCFLRSFKRKKSFDEILHFFI